MEDDTKFAELRARLQEADFAVDHLPKNATEATRKAAIAARDAAAEAVKKAHLDAKRAEDAKPALETRPAAPAKEARPEAPAKETRPAVPVPTPVAEPAVKPAEEAPEPEPAHRKLTFQEFIQAGTTQSVRGTDALTPEQHAARRNPKHT
jgi:hypothetical protein